MREDDVIAEDFFPSGANWRAIRDGINPRPDTALLDEIETQAHKQVAHLTYTRLDIKSAADKEWPCAEIIAAFEPVISAWVSNVASRYLVQWPRHRGPLRRLFSAPGALAVSFTACSTEAVWGIVGPMKTLGVSARADETGLRIDAGSGDDNGSET